MELLSPLLIISFFTIGIVFIAQPLFDSNIAIPPQVFDIDTFKRKKTILYRQIKELENDYSLGKVSIDDYKETRDRLKMDVSIVIREIRKTSS